MDFASAHAGDMVGAQAIPISQLHPDISDPNSRVVTGVITVTWPYSIVNRSIAFIIAEHDVRLRRNRGRLRVEFHGAAGRALDKFGAGAGDSVSLSLEGAQWERNEITTRHPLPPLEWQLKFEGLLHMKIRRDDSEVAEAIDVDVSAAPESPGSEPDYDISVLFEQPLQTNGLSSPQLPDFTSPKQQHALAFDTSEYYASPAYLKRARMSYGSLFEGGLDLFDDEENGRKRKRKRRSRFSLNASWRFTSRSPSPQAEQSSESESEGESEAADPVIVGPEPVTQPEPQFTTQIEPEPMESVPEPMETEPEHMDTESPFQATSRPPMVDQACQTQELDYSPRMGVQVAAESRLTGLVFQSTPTPLRRFETQDIGADAPPLLSFQRTTSPPGREHHFGAGHHYSVDHHQNHDQGHLLPADANGPFDWLVDSRHPHQDEGAPLPDSMVIDPNLQPHDVSDHYHTHLTEPKPAGSNEMPSFSPYPVPVPHVEPSHAEPFPRNNRLAENASFARDPMPSARDPSDRQTPKSPGTRVSSPRHHHDYQDEGLLVTASRSDDTVRAEDDEARNVVHQMQHGQDVETDADGSTDGGSEAEGQHYTWRHQAQSRRDSSDQERDSEEPDEKDYDEDEDDESLEEDYDEEQEDDLTGKHISGRPLSKPSGRNEHHDAEDDDDESGADDDIDGRSEEEEHEEEEDYSEEDYSEEDESPMPDARLMHREVVEPVVISLLSDSEDDDTDVQAVEESRTQPAAQPLPFQERINRLRSKGQEKTDERVGLEDRKAERREVKVEEIEEDGIRSREDQDEKGQDEDGDQGEEEEEDEEEEEEEDEEEEEEEEEEDDDDDEEGDHDEEEAEEAEGQDIAVGETASEAQEKLDEDDEMVDEQAEQEERKEDKEAEMMDVEQEIEQEVEQEVEQETEQEVEIEVEVELEVQAKERDLNLGRIDARDTEAGGPGLEDRDGGMGTEQEESLSDDQAGDVAEHGQEVGAEDIKADEDVEMGDHSEPNGRTVDEDDAKMHAVAARPIETSGPPSDSLVAVGQTNKQVQETPHHAEAAEATGIDAETKKEDGRKTANADDLANDAPASELQELETHVATEALAQTEQSAPGLMNGPKEFQEPDLRTNKGEHTSIASSTTDIQQEDMRYLTETPATTGNSELAGLITTEADASREEDESLSHAEVMHHPRGTETVIIMADASKEPADVRMTVDTFLEQPSTPQAGESRSPDLKDSPHRRREFSPHIKVVSGGRTIEAIDDDANREEAKEIQTLDVVSKNEDIEMGDAMIDEPREDHQEHSGHGNTPCNTNFETDEHKRHKAETATTDYEDRTIETHERLPSEGPHIHAGQTGSEDRFGKLGFKGKGLFAFMQNAEDTGDLPGPRHTRQLQESTADDSTLLSPGVVEKGRTLLPPPTIRPGVSIAPVESDAIELDHARDPEAPADDFQDASEDDGNRDDNDDMTAEQQLMEEFNASHLEHFHHLDASTPGPFCFHSFDGAQDEVQDSPRARRPSRPERTDLVITSQSLRSHCRRHRKSMSVESHETTSSTFSRPRTPSMKHCLVDEAGTMPSPLWCVTQLGSESHDDDPSVALARSNAIESDVGDAEGIPRTPNGAPAARWSILRDRSHALDDPSVRLAKSNEQSPEPEYAGRRSGSRFASSSTRRSVSPMKLRALRPRGKQPDVSVQLAKSNPLEASEDQE